MSAALNPYATSLPEFLSVADVAARLAVKVDTVLLWLHGGELAGINVARKRGGHRPRWRISRDAFDRFLTARSTTPPPAVSRKRRRKPEGIIEFF